MGYQKELPLARPDDAPKSKLQHFLDVYVLLSLWMAISDTTFRYSKLFINDRPCLFIAFRYLHIEQTQLQ